MRNVAYPFLLLTVLSFALQGCGPGPTQTVLTAVLSPRPAIPTLTKVPPKPTLEQIPASPTQKTVLSTPTQMPLPTGKTIVVTSAKDSSPGTLRQALFDAQMGDTITFDPEGFPPDNPITIFLSNEDQDSALPPINQGGITIDASDAGVILDGSNLSGDPVNGLELYSDRNTVEGLQMFNFPGMGIIICDGSYNRIGGDRKLGRSPIGQVNLSSKNSYGIGLCGKNTSFNTITGNLIGTDPTGTYQLAVNHFWINNEWGNRYDGIWLEDGSSLNIIGPDNIIAFNHYNGIRMNGENVTSNMITENSIFNNARAGIQLSAGSNKQLCAPVIQDFDLQEDISTGTACANCKVEIYSDENSEG